MLCASLKITWKANRTKMISLGGMMVCGVGFVCFTLAYFIGSGNVVPSATIQTTTPITNKPLEIDPNSEKNVQVGLYAKTKCFDYSTNNGTVQIINGSSVFNIRFSKSSDHDIFVLSSASNISAVARVRNTRPTTPIEFSKLDSSSSSYTVRVGEQFIVKNNNGEFFQGKILSVKDDRYGPVDEVCFAYEFDQSGVGHFLAL